jgi:ABC-type nitrate/sulfonate/bicarbonate transport system substrate-binding protein
MSTFELNRRKFLIGAQALAVGAALPAMPGLARAQEAVKMTYLTPFGYIIGFSEALYADSAGIFKKHGLDVTVEGGRGSSMAVQQVTAGNALVSRTGGTDLIKAYARDPSIVAVGEIYQRDIFYVISSKDAPIEKPEDMAGKTIGIVSAAGATENLLDMMLTAKDIAKDEVKREVVGNAPAAFQLIKQGRISAFIATNDTAYQLQSTNEAVTAWSTDEVARCPGQVYMTSKAQLAEKKDVIAKFLAAVYESAGEIGNATDVSPMLASMNDKFQLAEAAREDKGLAVLQYAAQNLKRAHAEKLKSNAEAWTSAYSLMVKAGLIPELPDQNFYDDSARMLAFP